MAALTPEVKAALILASQGQAIAFLEDMSHIREVLARQGADRGEVRLLSNVLRRLLTDKGGDLPAIAAPRIGRIKILTPNNKLFYVAARKKQFRYFASGGATVFGVMMRASLYEGGATSIMAGTAFDPDDKVELSLDSFLSQHVICLLGEWVSRRAVIKFIANIAHGVHSGTPKGDTERDDAILAKARSSVNYAQKDGGFHFSLHLDQIHGTPPPLAYDPKSIDPVLFELLSTAYFLATSADVLALENIIRQEVGV